jgi:hypothetical protein
MTITGKCSDSFGCRIANTDHGGYVPNDIGIGGGDYIEIVYCLNCGQIQGSNFPLPPCKLEATISKEDFFQFYDDHFSEGKAIFKFQSRSILKDAEVYGEPFQKFLKNLFDFNSFAKMESAKVLWLLFSNKDY